MDMDFKKLAFNWFDKIIAVVVVVLALYLVVSGLMGAAEIRKERGEVDDLIEEARIAVASVAPGKDPSRPAKDKLVADYVEVPDGKIPDGASFRKYIFYRPGELTDQQGIELIAKGEAKDYDYNAVFERSGLAAEDTPIIADDLRNKRIATLAVSEDGKIVTIRPGSVAGETWAGIRFASGRMIQFLIVITDIPETQFDPPALLAIEGGHGDVTIIWQPDGKVPVEKYQIERSEQAETGFTLLKELDAPPSHKLLPKLIETAPAEPEALEEAEALPEGEGAPEGEAGEEPAEEPTEEPTETAAEPVEPPALPAPPALGVPGIELATYVDQSVLPNRTYYYRVRAKSVQPDDPLAKVPEYSGYSNAEQIDTFDVISVRLESVIGGQAGFRITRWVDGIEVDKPFFVKLGQKIGGRAKVRIGEGRERQWVDFSTGKILLDMGTSPKWDASEREVVSYGPQGQKIITKERTLRETQSDWAILYSPESGAELMWKSPRIRRVREKPAPKEAGAPGQP